MSRDVGDDYASIISSIIAVADLEGFFFFWYHLLAEFNLHSSAEQKPPFEILLYRYV